MEFVSDCPCCGGMGYTSAMNEGQANEEWTVLWNHREWCPFGSGRWYKTKREAVQPANTRTVRSVLKPNDA